MNKNLIITIARQFGSGGKEIGRRLAHELNLPCYEKHSVIQTAREMGIQQELFDQAEERVNDSLIYSLAMGQYGKEHGNVPELTLYDKIYSIQSSIIKQAAERGPCVIVGRSAGAILKDLPYCVRLFVHADIKKRLERAVEYYHLTPENTNEAYIRRRDQRRSNYHQYYNDLQWEEAASYHLAIDSGETDLDCCVRIMLEYLKTYCKKRELPFPPVPVELGQKG
ncbi:MAG: cytidylate kinase-like family protein [Clostridiales bacterium]|jgi:cytidylate kinase|nr:cytidylate kinase-like family protein [Clostridiales bacterium]